MKKMNLIGRYLLLFITGMSCKQAYAQLSPFGAMYYQNQYVNNPAYAGLNQGLQLDGGVRIQDSKMPGSPKTQFLTGMYALNDKAGVGLNLNTEQIGLIKKVRTVASFAYHLPIAAQDNTLSFGLSIGFASQSIDYSLMAGDQNDASVVNFNQRETYADGDFGIRYGFKNFSVEAALLNISDYIRNNNGKMAANVAKYYLAGSYKIQLSPQYSNITIEPKIAYRVIDGNKDIADFGTNLSVINSKLNFLAIYHSSQNATFGLGASLLDNVYMNLMYTSATAVLASENTGTFEVNLKVKLPNKK